MTDSLSVKEVTSKFIEKDSISKTLISKELTIFHDSIFNSKPIAPQEIKDVNYSQYLILEDKFKKSYNKNNNNNEMKNNWKKSDDGNNDFFDNFKGKCNQFEVQNFKRNIEMVSTHSTSIMIASNKLFDYGETPLILRSVGSKEATEKEQKSISVDDFFNSNFEEKDNTEFKKSSTYLKLPLIDCLYRVNERINYPKDKPLWYVYHSEADSSYGPLSSEDIEQMIISNLLEESSKIRLIDAFLYRGCKQFEFFQLKDIQLENFADSIKVSPLATNFKVNNNPGKKVNKDDSFSSGKSKLVFFINNN